MCFCTRCEHQNLLTISVLLDLSLVMVNECGPLARSAVAAISTVTIRANHIGPYCSFIVSSNHIPPYVADLLRPSSMWYDNPTFPLYNPLRPPHPEAEHQRTLNRTPDLTDLTDFTDLTDPTLLNVVDNTRATEINAATLQ